MSLLGLQLSALKPHCWHRTGDHETHGRATYRKEVCCWCGGERIYVLQIDDSHGPHKKDEFRGGEHGSFYTVLGGIDEYRCRVGKPWQKPVLLNERGEEIPK